MKLGVDIKNAPKSRYRYFKDIIEYFIKKDVIKNINIYSDSSFDILDDDKVQTKYSVIDEQYKFLKTLKKDKNDIIISFDDTFPILYKWSFIKVVFSLDRIFYPDLESNKFFNKYSYLNIFKNNLKHSYKIICFSDSTKSELNDRLNIKEEKILKINNFFPSSPIWKNNINIKQTLDISGDYLIFDYEWYNNNIERVLQVIKAINKDRDLSIVLIGEKLYNSDDTREYIQKLWIEDRAHLVWDVSDNDLESYYKNSIWVIYPIIYDMFPLSLNHAINYDIPIFASENIETREIFGDNINYFSGTSQSSIKKSIENSLWSIKKVDYVDIRQKYSIKNFINNLFAIIS